MSKYQRVVVVIPARYQAQRFPGKPLAKIAGKPMVEWVYEVARKLKAGTKLVATEDQRIYDCVKGFGGDAVMTAATHATGTDRIAEAVRDLDVDLVINFQGDEPLMPATPINDLIERMLANPQAPMGTIAVPLAPTDPGFLDPNIVKVVVDKDGNALYFSRSPIPCFRNPGKFPYQPLKHWGIYAYRKSFLNQMITWPQTALELSESLEQLRVLENGGKILVVIAEGTSETASVDVPEDIQRVEAILRRKA
jgi:3-deoxy-manno-octulosonate cytidylyltransferase (CMP-KDO synthetase)